MRGLRWLCVILSLTIEVRLKAAVHQEPNHCLTQIEDICSLFAFKPTIAKTKQFELLMSAGSILYRDKNKKWNFVSGTIRIETKKNMTLYTIIGSITLEPGIKWLRWEDKQLWVYSIEGNTQILLTSTLMKENNTPEGFYNWYGLVNRNGINEQGIPRTITGSNAKLTLSGIRKHNDLKLIQKRESRSLAMVSDFYKDVAQQMEDNAFQREQQASLKEMNRIQQEKRIRELFRKKFLSPVEDLDETPENDTNNQN